MHLVKCRKYCYRLNGNGGKGWECSAKQRKMRAVEGRSSSVNDLERLK